MKINFLLAANINDSLNRISVEWANSLIEMGHEVVISFPCINHIDYYRWVFSWNLKNRGKIFGWVIALLRFLNSVGNRNIFCIWKGFEISNPSNKIILNRFFSRATNQNMPNADYIIAMNGVYLVPNMMFLSEKKGEVISSIHMNYQHAIVDPMPVVAEWNSCLIEIEKRVSVRRFAESLKNIQACQLLNIPVEGSIPPGVNLNQFSDGLRRGELTSQLRITLFCHPRSHKGLAEGIEVVERIKNRNISQNICFSTLGYVGSFDVSIFDHHFGYLSQSEYPKALKETDIFIYPELYSGFGVPPLHAMASGCAVVLNEIDGTDEYGQDRENCMMSNPGDIDMMTDNVEALIKNYSLRDKIRDAAVLTASKFSWQHSARRLIEFLNEE